jgi:hypothetical protein
MRDMALMDVADAIATLGATGASSSAVHECVEALLADVPQRRDAAVSVQAFLGRVGLVSMNDLSAAALSAPASAIAPDEGLGAHARAADWEQLGASDIPTSLRSLTWERCVAVGPPIRTLAALGKDVSCQ